ncbi:MAG: mechanosensitive ion channel [Planctomycetes bacterium]|nr:mechanosensitive ion channel [Planctomycetota bacterium]
MPPSSRRFLIFLFAAWVLLVAPRPGRSEPPDGDEAEVEESNRESLRRELAEKDPTALVGTLPTLQSRRTELAAAATKAAEVFDAAVLGVAERESRLSSLTPPVADSIVPESTRPEVRQAEREFRFAEAMSAWREARAGALEELRQALVAAEKCAADLDREARELGDQLLRLEIVLETVAGHIEEGRLPATDPASTPDVATVREDRAGARGKSRGARDAATEYQARRVQVEQASRDLKQERIAEDPKRAALERAWVSAQERERWTRELRELGVDTLAARLVESRTGLETSEARALEEESAALEAERVAEDLRAQTQAVQEPLAGRARQQYSAERSRLLAELTRRHGQESPSTEYERTALTSGIESRPLNPPPRREEFTTRVEEREAFLATRVQSLDERLRLRAAWIDAMRRVATARADVELALLSASENRHRAWGAAVELRERAARGEVPPESAPAGDDPLLAVESFSLLEGRIEQARARRSSADERLAAAVRRNSELESLRDLLSADRRLSGSVLESLQELARFEAAASVQQTSLPEEERKRLEQLSRVRRTRDDSALEAAAGCFESERSTELWDLLLSYYVEALFLENRRISLLRQDERYRAILRLTVEELPLVETEITAARAELILHQAEEAELFVRTGLIPPGDPAAAGALRAAGRAIPVPEPVPPERIAATADALFEARMRTAGTAAWLADLLRRQSGLGIHADADFCRDALGRVAARMDAVEREISKLSGGGSETGGLIHATREERRSALVASASLALLRFCAIPLIALFLIAAARWVGNRLQDRAGREASASPEMQTEQRQRAETLVHVFRSAWNTVVVIAAIVCMLRELRLDVTPIVASAGIVGLAVAFGAQPLIRDFFAGFFILLENQYKIGDIIKIGTTGGVVERITMRLTVLRDLEGVAHFIPNGTVNQVSNMTKGWARAVLDIGVAYREDVDRVLEVLRKVGDELEADASWSIRLSAAPEVLGIEEFGENAVTLRMLLKTQPAEQWSVAREARRRIKKAFDERGIEIPFPQRVIYQVGSEPSPAVGRLPRTDVQAHREGPSDDTR